VASSIALVNSGNIIAFMPCVGGAQDEIVRVVSAAYAAKDATENAAAAMPVLNKWLIVYLLPFVLSLCQNPSYLLWPWYCHLLYCPSGGQITAVFLVTLVT
jgi:hypothetical protein